jgi:hypothetical protein
MLQEMKVENPSQQQEIYSLLISKYEKSLYLLGMDNEEVASEVAEFIQVYNLFK